VENSNGLSPTSSRSVSHNHIVTHCHIRNPTFDKPPTRRDSNTDGASPTMSREGSNLRAGESLNDGLAGSDSTLQIQPETQVDSLSNLIVNDGRSSVPTYGINPPDTDAIERNRGMSRTSPQGQPELLVTPRRMTPMQGNIPQDTTQVSMSQNVRDANPIEAVQLSQQSETVNTTNDSILVLT